ncbi:MAG: sel1 repeat family protein, partial [Alphaproteobacteria bacterium]|nr:sel1 repeat family protein [Alphaproteobacteria bacterium]
MFLCLAALLLLSSAARADYEAGQAAWEAGRHSEALTQWEAAAGAGDSRAMLALGRTFVKGLGVRQDYVLAHKWLNLAAGRG